MSTDGGLTGRFLRAFILQAALISVTAMLGVWLARFVLEDVLIEQALMQEAAWFWDQRDADPSARPPEARNITSYLGAETSDREASDREASNGQLTGPAPPSGFEDLPPGLHPLSSGDGVRTLHVSERDGLRLYLVFDGAGVDLLTTWFGLAPLALVLAALYLTAWVGYRATHQALSPITALARQIAGMDVERLDAEVLRQPRFTRDPDEEVAVLARALADFTERLDAFVERERDFTRDASHELRSPITVIAMAVDVLRSEGDLSPRAEKALGRIDRAVRDMQSLVEAFLLLAREAEVDLERERVCLNELVADELERVRLTASGQLETALEAEGLMHVTAPRQVLASMIGNVIRNAAAYGGGRVRVQLADGVLHVEDRGEGMDADSLARAFDPFFRAPGSGRGGHGVGLTIVRRLSDRFGWPVSVDSEPGVGTRVHITFPAAEFDTAAGAGERRDLHALQASSSVS